MAETLNLSQLEGYTTGGTIHLVINNQIGFTTNPDEARSTPYSTDVARMVQAPIFHVNGDDPEACVRVAQMAYDYRQEFKKDVVIDMFCYRRHGHNEGDDPSYTQPILYRKIRQHPSVAVQYSERLVREDFLDSDQVKQIRAKASAAPERGLRRREEEGRTVPGAGSERGGSGRDRPAEPGNRGGSRDAGARGGRHHHVPSRIPCASQAGGQPARSAAKYLNGAPMDWATAETLAFGSLVLEGTPVRLSGQDSGRGTFSQRHLELYDSENGERYIPLQHLSPNQARFDVFDSSLSEYAVMGFEFGYSVADPLTLVLWEAQFGDFANGAQILIDQFHRERRIQVGTAERPGAAAAARLRRARSRAFQRAHRALPATLRRKQHAGGERQHAGAIFPCAAPPDARRSGSARRSQAADHIYAQAHAAPSPAVSTLDELMTGTFHEILDDTATLDRARVTRVLMCSGQVYYDLAGRARRTQD